MTEKNSHKPTREQLVHRLMMLALLSAEAGKWAYSLNKVVEQRFKMKLNNFIGAAESLRREMTQWIDPDELDEASIVFSGICEKLTDDETRNAFLDLCAEYFNGSLEIIQKADEGKTV